MIGNLIILFKDKVIDKAQFDHLADVVIQNQYLTASSPALREMEFEANQEELQKLHWFVQFSELDVMYVLDRSLEIRQRLIDNPVFGGKLKLADIILVQMDNEIYCVKQTDGMKSKMRFACRNLAILNAKTEQEKWAEMLYQADEMLDAFRQERGDCCERCGFMDSLKALRFYRKFPLVYYPTGVSGSNLMEISMIRYGRLRTFDEVYEEVKDAQLLCYNCASVIRDGLGGGNSPDGAKE